METETMSNDEVWSSDLLQIIADHPSLCTLDLKYAVPDGDGLTQYEKLHLTQQIVSLLKTNQQLEKIEFHDENYDRVEWDTEVVPRLECNLYRKHSRALAESGIDAVLADAMGHVSATPSNLWMFVSQHQGTIAESLLHRAVGE